MLLSELGIATPHEPLLLRNYTTSHPVGGFQSNSSVSRSVTPTMSDGHCFFNLHHLGPLRFEESRVVFVLQYLVPAYTMQSHGRRSASAPMKGSKRQKCQMSAGGRRLEFQVPVCGMYDLVAPTRIVPCAIVIGEEI